MATTAIDNIVFNQMHVHASSEILLEERSVIAESNPFIYFQIGFIQKHNHIWGYRFLNGESILLDTREDPPIISELFHVNPQYILLHGISSQLFPGIQMFIRPSHLASVMPLISSKVQQKILSSVSNDDKGRNLFLKCSVEITYLSEYLHDESLEISSVLESSMEELEERGLGMIPASRISIDGLEKTILHQDSDETCTICLEEVSAGSHVIRMPCSHVFHGNCIVEWLEKSNCCPICRFKLS